jgi:hypothetical protein
MTPIVSEDSLKRIAAADDLLTATLSRLPSAERMRHAPTVGVVKVLFGGVRERPATVSGRADDDWAALLDKLEPQFDLCEAAATVKDLTNRFIILGERIGRILDDIAALAVVVEPHCPERERLARLTLLAQQEILTLAGTQLDRKLSRIEEALARHRSTDETRTGKFYQSLRGFEATFAKQAAQQTMEHDLRLKRWEGEFAALAGRLKDATDVEEVERITRFYDPAERQERIRVNVYASLCVAFIVIAIAAAAYGFYAHATTQSIASTAGSATLFTLLSSAAAIMRREQRVHRDRLWAVENDHRRMVGSVLFHHNMTDEQRERFVEGFFSGNAQREVPTQASSKRSTKVRKSWQTLATAQKQEK